MTKYSGQWKYPRDLTWKRQLDGCELAICGLTGKASFGNDDDAGFTLRGRETLAGRLQNVQSHPKRSHP